MLSSKHLILSCDQPPQPLSVGKYPEATQVWVAEMAHRLEKELESLHTTTDEEQKADFEDRVTRALAGGAHPRKELTKDVRASRILLSILTL